MNFKFLGRHIGSIHFRFGHSILVGPNGQPVPENIGIDFEISLISCLGVEKHVFQVLRPPYWFFPLPFWSHSILVVPNR